MQANFKFSVFSEKKTELSPPGRLAVDFSSQIYKQKIHWIV